MTQGHWLHKINLESFFIEEKTTKDFLKYFFQKSSSIFCILFLGIIKNNILKFKQNICKNVFFETFRNIFWDTLKKTTEKKKEKSNLRLLHTSQLLQEILSYQAWYCSNDINNVAYILCLHGIIIKWYLQRNEETEWSKKRLTTSRIKTIPVLF